MSAAPSVAVLEALVSRIPSAAMAVVMAVLVSACSSAASSPAASSPTPAPSAIETAIRVADFQVTPAEVRLVAGEIAFQVANDGPTPHNLTVRDAAGTILAATPELRPGTAAQLVKRLAAGTYVLFCSLPGHESLGMRATLIVAE